MLLFAQRRGRWLWTAATIALCGLLLFNNGVYLPGQPTPRFFLEKGELARAAWWRAAFYFHLIGASVCLLAGLPLMFPAWTRRHPVAHRRLGELYINAVLWMGAPGGLLLAPVAKGGVWGTAGFAVAGVLWWATTWSGYVAIRRGDLDRHIREMLRSYSLALSAPAFRVFQVSLFVAGVGDELNYLVSLWLSVAFSLWLAETSWRRRPRHVVTGGAPSLLGATR